MGNSSAHPICDSSGKTGDSPHSKEGKWESGYSKDVAKHVKKHGILGIEELLKAKLEEWKRIEIHIGVTGDAGVGKSSCVNAIRGVKDDSKDAAKTGIIETTTEAKDYPHPTNNKITFWDLPGIGTPTYPIFENYRQAVGLEKYDTFLILAAKRFTENDRLLAEEVKSLKKSFFFVRTHIDENYRAESKKDGFDEKKMLDDIRRECLKNLKRLKVEDKAVFLISNNEPEKWDFHRLTKSILDDLPLRQKESIMLSFTTLSKDLVKQKVEILRGRIWMVAAASGAGGLVPVPGLSVSLDLALLTKEVNLYKSQLGLPKEDSEVFRGLTPEMKAKIHKFCLTSAVQIGHLLTAYAASSTVEEFARYIPLVGGVIAGGISFYSTYNFLRGCLNELEETALDFLDEMEAKVGDDMGLDSASLN